MTSRLEPNQILHGDSREVLKDFPASSVDSVVTDPPAGIAFMAKEWDDPDAWKYPISSHGFTDGGDRVPAPAIGASSRNPNCRKCRRHKRGWKDVPGCQCAEPDFDTTENRLADRDAFVAFLQAIMAECLRVLKPGGHAIVWSIPRTSHWTALAIEQAGFEIRDCIYHVFGCLSEDTEILTESGWELYHTLEEGRLALCYDLERDLFEWQPIQQVYVYPYRDTAYRLRGDHTDQIVSRNHRCLVERGGAFAFEYAEEIARERQACVPVLEDLSGLLQAIPLPHKGAGDAKSDMLTRLLKQEHRDQKQRSSNSSGDLPGMWTIVSSQEQCVDTQRQILHNKMCGNSTRVRSSFLRENAEGWCSWAQGVDTGRTSLSRREDDGPSQPSLEGRSGPLLEARELRVSEVRPLPAGVSTDGTQGQVRRGAPTHRGESVGALSHADGNGTSHRSQPYRQQAGESHALRLESGSQAVRGTRFTTTDLVRVEPVEYDGIVWCVRVPSGAFVARRAGKAFVTGNSGFPKSLNISKAIDKSKGATREVIGTYRVGGNALTPTSEKGGTYGVNAPNSPPGDLNITKPATPEAEAWDGWGTALKPAVECWWLCRKPIEAQNVAAQVLKTGTGAINIDATRVPGAPQIPSSIRARRRFDDRGDEPDLVPPPAPNPGGRWPSNFILSHTPDCRKVGEQEVSAPVINRFDDGMKPFGEGAGHPYTQSGGGLETVPIYECPEGCPVRALNEQGEERGIHPAGSPLKAQEKWDMSETTPSYGGGFSGPSGMRYGDDGGAARFFLNLETPFFYTAKAAKSEKEDGLEEFGKSARVNTHPTVKSVALMRYLVRMVTPKGGLVLDPFAGSGSTLIAAIQEGDKFIGIEREEEYIKIAQRRVSTASERSERSQAERDIFELMMAIGESDA